MHLLTESIWITTHFYSLFQILLESVLHPFLLLRPCYLSMDVMTHLTRWAGIMIEILLHSHWGVSHVYILILLVKETKSCKWFMYLDTLCWDVYIWFQFCWICCGTSWLLMPNRDVIRYIYKLDYFLWFTGLDFLLN